MVPFERALVSFYRPSIVTFPLSLRVSEILPLLFSCTLLFPYPTSIQSPPNFPTFPREQVDRLLATKSEGVVQLVSKISNLCDHNPPTSQTDRETDRRTTCGRKTALCTKAHCAVKIESNQITSRSGYFKIESPNFRNSILSIIGSNTISRISEPWIRPTQQPNTGQSILLSRRSRIVESRGQAGVPRAETGYSAGFGWIVTDNN